MNVVNWSRGFPHPVSEEKLWG